MRKPKLKHQSFDDGVLTVYEAINGAAPGNVPALKIKALETLRYEERTVGMKRYWEGKRENITTSLLLRVPYRRELRPSMVVIPTDGEQYDIKAIQPIVATEPPTMDLTLERRSSWLKKEADDA